MYLVKKGNPKIKRQTNVNFTQMETYTYVCNYCKKEYIPSRRGIQKFCSNSCRTRSHQIKKQNANGLSKNTNLAKLKPLPKTKIDQISAVGVGNAALGSALVDFGKHIFTPEHQKAATKGDIKNLENKIVKR